MVMSKKKLLTKKGRLKPAKPRYKRLEYMQNADAEVKRAEATVDLTERKMERLWKQAEAEELAVMKKTREWGKKHKK